MNRVRRRRQSLTLVAPPENGDDLEILAAPADETASLIFYETLGGQRRARDMKVLSAFEAQEIGLFLLAWSHDRAMVGDTVLPCDEDAIRRLRDFERERARRMVSGEKAGTPDLTN